MNDASLPSESPRRASRVAVLLLAAGLAAVGAALAPRPWPAGPGEVRVTVGDGAAAATPVVVGEGRAVTIEASGAGREVVVDLPRGVPTKGELRALLRVSEGGEAVRPALDAVRLDLVLADGRRELIPVVGWDEAAEGLRARRRPPVHASVVLGLLALIVVLWVSEVYPLWVGALLVPVVLVVSGAGGAAEALAPFFHPIIALFFGGFLLAAAMQRVRLDHLAAVALVTWGGRSPGRLFAAILFVSAFLSMWMSNTASTAVLLPIVLAVTAPLGHPGFRKMAVLGLAFAATIGGVGSAVGTPANPLAIDFLGTFAGRRIAFTDWFAFGLPMVVVFVPVMGLYLWWRMGGRVDRDRFRRARWVALREYARVRRPNRKQAQVLGVFALVMAVWLTQTWHGINTGIVAVGGVVLLAALGRLETEDLSKISWEALLTFGGGIALGVFMVRSGTSDWVATRLEGLAALPPFFAVAGVALLALGLTAVASNTATAAMLVPLAIPLATVLHVDPVLLVVVVAIASSVDFALVIGTPPTMLAYSTRLFTAREIFRVGIVLDVVGILLLVTVVAASWKLLGVL